MILLIVAVIGLTSAALIPLEERNFQDDLEDFLSIVALDDADEQDDRAVDLRLAAECIDNYAEILGEPDDEALRHRLIRSLSDDFSALNSCLPWSYWQEVMYDYLYDNETQEFFAFFKSDKFREVVEVVDVDPEFIKFMDFLVGNGVDSYGFLNEIHDKLGLPHMNQTSSNETTPTEATLSRQRRSIVHFYYSLKSFIYWMPILETWADRIQHSEDFQEFYDFVCSDDFHKLVLKVLNMKNIKELVQTLKDEQLPVDEIAEFFNNLLGWHSTTETTSTSPQTTPV